MPYDPRFRSGVVHLFVAFLEITIIYDLWRIRAGEGEYAAGFPVAFLLLLLVLFAVSDEDTYLLYDDPDRTFEYVAGLVLLASGLGVTSFGFAPRPIGTVLLAFGTVVHPTTRSEILREAENWGKRFDDARQSLA